MISTTQCTTTLQHKTAATDPLACTPIQESNDIVRFLRDFYLHHRRIGRTLQWNASSSLHLSKCCPLLTSRDQSMCEVSACLTA